MEDMENRIEKLEKKVDSLVFLMKLQKEIDKESGILMNNLDKRLLLLGNSVDIICNELKKLSEE